MNAVEVVSSFWAAMKTNDFHAASRWLAVDYVCYWPQSKETIKGRDNFVSINTEYPAEGQWLFDIQEIIGDGDRVVSDVLITDGKLCARAVTFHTVKDGLIVFQKEFWPEGYEAPEWRSQWVEHDKE